MSANNIPAGLKVPTQTPLDAKLHVASQAVLSNLGSNNNLAYTYYEGMIVYCVAERTRWEWRQEIPGEITMRLLLDDFTYPNNLVVDGVTYSNKVFNFFRTSLQGPTGLKGDKGDKGDQGDPGQDATGLSGGGTNNYVAKWTPSGSELGDSQIRDDGANMSINSGLAGNTKLIISSDKVFGLSVQQTVQGIAGQYYATVSGTSSNTGIQGRASASTTANTGGDFLATGTGTDIAIGGTFSAASGASNYSLRLQDGTQGIGKFLKSITNSGEANWANIVVGDIKSGTSTLGQVITSDGAGNSTWTTPTSSGLSGSGTNNYVAKWTPNGTQLGDSQIRDDGNAVGVNVAPNSGVQFFVNSTKNIGVYSTMSGTGDSIGMGTYVNGASTRNVGIEAQVTAGSKNIGLNLGVAGPLYVPFTNFDHGIVSAARATTKGNIGGYFIAEGGTSNYALALKDGTESVGKVLTCATSDGKANWATPTTPNLQKVITTSYALTDVDDGYTIFINNNTTPISISLGAITVANFCVGFIQEGSADVTFSGVTNPVGLKSKGQGYQTFIERKLSTSTYYLLGNTKV